MANDFVFLLARTSSMCSEDNAAQGYIVHKTILAIEKGLRFSLSPNIPIFVNVPWKLVKIYLHFYYRCI